MPAGNGSMIEDGSGGFVWERGRGTSEFDDGLIAPIIGAAIMIFLLFAIFISIIVKDSEDSKEDTQWNGGICAACGTPWHYLDSVGTVNSTRYIYECECGNHRMESYTLR